jgi:hypothetical protein
VVAAAVVDVTIPAIADGASLIGAALLWRRRAARNLPQQESP